MNLIPMRFLPLLAIPAALQAASALPYSEDFESIPADADNVPNVTLTTPAVPLQWYNRYYNLGSSLGFEDGALSVAMLDTSKGANRWPDPSTPARSSVLSVGWAYEAVKTVCALDLEDKWDSSKTYEFSFQWAISNHGSKTGRDFKAKVFGASPTQVYEYPPGEPPILVDALRSDPLAFATNAGAIIKEVDLDAGGTTPFDVVQNTTITISGADIIAAGQDGHQIYFGFDKGPETEFFMVDNVTFEEVIPLDTDGDGIPDPYETGGLQAGGTLGPYVSPADTGTFLDVADSDGDGIDDGDEVDGETVSGFGYTSDPTLVNSDGDTLDDGDEINGTLNVLYSNAPTDPGSADTDGDLIDDDVEINVTGTNPADPDTDGDGINDGEEDVNQDGVVDPTETSATSDDTDGDGLTDDWEIDNGLDATGTDDSNGDPDGDLLVNTDELTAGSDPNDADSDNDGLNDKFEWDSTGLGSLLDPLNRDTDGDGLGDKFEVDNGLDPFLDADFDADTFSDTDEVMFFGTDPKDVLDFPGDADSAGPGGLTPIMNGGPVGASATFGLGGTLDDALVNEAAQGGSNIDVPNGVLDFSIVYSNLFEAAGSEVSLTGFAWAVTGKRALNDDGEILVEFYDPGADGVFDGVDTDTLVGSATGSLTVVDTNGVMYWNFANPINFTSEGTALAVRFLSTGKLRVKVQNDFATGYRYSNQGDGPITANNSMRLSIGGTAVAPGITMGDVVLAPGQATVTWSAEAMPGGVDIYRSTDLVTWTGPISTADTDGTHTDTSAPAGKAFYLAVPSGTAAP